MKMLKVSDKVQSPGVCLWEVQGREMAIEEMNRAVSDQICQSLEER